MGYFIDQAGATVRATPGTTLRDPRGLACSTSSPQAVDHVESALEAMLSYFGDPLAALDGHRRRPGLGVPAHLKAGFC